MISGYHEQCMHQIIENQGALSAGEWNGSYSLSGGGSCNELTDARLGGAE